jgi:hypothetical protein
MDETLPGVDWSITPTSAPVGSPLNLPGHFFTPDIITVFRVNMINNMFFTLVDKNKFDMFKWFDYY